MPQYPDYPAVGSLDGTEELAVTVNPGGSELTKRATTAQIAALAGSGTVVATLNGSTAGHAYVVQRANSSSYKEYVIILVAWQDSGQTYVWPTAYATLAVLLDDVLPPSTLTTAHIIFGNSVGAAVNGVITVKGF